MSATTNGQSQGARHPPREETNAVFNHVNLTKQQIGVISNMICEEQDSFESHIRKGHEPAWLTGSFIDSMTKMPTKRIYAAWVDASTKRPLVPLKPNQGMAPPFYCITPAGPLGRTFITPDSCLNVKNVSASSITQRVYFKTDEYDEEVFERFKKCLDRMHLFFNEDRARAMAFNVRDHDMLSFEDRALGENDPEALFEKIMAALANDNDSSHRTCATHGPKHKMIKDVKLRKNQNAPTDVSEVDKITLDQLDDPSQQIRTWIEEKNGMRTLQLLPITLPDATLLQPNEIGYINGDGGVASMTWVCYGVHCRRDGPLQHTVMLQNAGVQVFSNGKKQGLTKKSFNVMDILAGKSPETTYCAPEPTTTVPDTSTENSIDNGTASPVPTVDSPNGVSNVRKFMKRSKKEHGGSGGSSSSKKKSRTMVFPDDD